MLEKFLQRQVQRSRQERRLMTVVNSTARVAGQRATYSRARDALQRLQERKSRAAYGGSLQGRQTHLGRREQEEGWRDVHSSRVQPDMHQCHNRSTSYDGAQTTAQERSKSYEGGSRSVDARTGDSVVQLEFNALVRRALLAYGPPLPAEFVLDNHVSLNIQHHREPKTTNTRDDEEEDVLGDAEDDDVGADGTSFFFYDEVALRVHELVAIIRRLRPDFDLRRDCGGVPLSLLIQNCPYLRAFGGKVRYMRYLRRPSSATAEQPRLVLSIAKYKMREMPSQDRIRQGPQPWLYGHMW